MRRVALGVLAGVLLTACLGDPVGPRGMLVVQHMGGSDSALVGAPGRALPQPIQFRLLDGAGRPVPGATVHWSAVAGGGRITASDLTTREDGTFAAQWELGTRAGDAQQLSAEVVAGGHHAVAEVSAVAVPVEVTALSLQAETTEVRLAVPGQVRAVATDPFGNHFVPNDIHFIALDTAVAVDSTGGVLAHHRGFARVVATASGYADTAVVHAIQVVASIQVDRDTLRFHSLGQGLPVGVTLVDDQGLPVADSFPVVVASDSAVIAVQPGASLLVQSVANGVADVQLQAGSVTRQVVALVRQRTATLTFIAPAFTFDALDDTTRAGLTVLDSLGVPVESPRIAYFSSDTAIVAIDSMGLLRARGNGSVTIRAQSLSGVIASVGATVTQRVAQVTVAQPSIRFEALQATVAAGAVARDRLGSPVAGAAVSFSSADSSVAQVDAAGTVRALGNGATTVMVTSDSAAVAVPVAVAQKPVRVRADTVRFDALADSASVSAVALDSLGSPVSGGVTALRVTDTTVVDQLDSVTVRARANGVTTAAVTVAGVTGQIVIAVHQVATTMTAGVGFGKAIVTLPVGAAVPVQCQAFDRNGYQTPDDPSLLSSAVGTVAGIRCSDLRVQRSGLDTLTLGVGAALTRVVLTVAAAPVVSSPSGEVVVTDTLLGSGMWAPSAFRNAVGELEVDYTSYDLDSSGNSRGNLQRLVWLGGTQFRYDGQVLAHGDSLCDPQGQGIENVVVMPRADSVGWRMLYAAGSNECYGWQVFSAVSADGRTWTKEAGVRLSNGGIAVQGMPPWPVGEGLVADRLPSGEWRLLVGTFEHITPPETNKWQIAEWRSRDQVTWTYVGVVLTTQDMPSGWQGSVYSPTVRQVAPGLWRMLFTADGRGTSGSRSAIWSAVSTDQVHWQVEGEVLGGVGSNLYYSALVDDQVVSIRQEPAGMRLVIASVVMP